MLLRTLNALLLVAMTAPPFLLILAGCSFRHVGPHIPEFDAGEGNRTDAIFCNVEEANRCATDEEIAMGVDIADQIAGGFHSTKPATKFGLDYSSEATAACQGKPRVLVYKGSFPDGSPVCMNAATTFAIGTFASVTQACQSFCESLGGIDNDGNAFRCANVAWPATGAQHDPVPNACTDAGTLRTDFVELRRIKPRDVLWRDKVNIDPTTSPDILRTSSTSHAFDATAASLALLRKEQGDGYFEFEVPDATSDLVAGLAVGEFDLGPNPADVTFGVAIRSGQVVAFEAGIEKSMPLLYTAGTRIRVTVVGSINPQNATTAPAVIQYLLDGKVFHSTPTTVTYPLRAKAVFRSAGAAVKSAATTF